jgi:hypothetical protein
MSSLSDIYQNLSNIYRIFITYFKMTLTDDERVIRNGMGVGDHIVLRSSQSIEFDAEAEGEVCQILGKLHLVHQVGLGGELQKEMTFE